MDLILKFSADEAGASAVEYALLMAFIAVAIAASVRLLAPPSPTSLIIPVAVVQVAGRQRA